MMVHVGTNSLCLPVPDGWKLIHEPSTKTIKITNGSCTATFTYDIDAKGRAFLQWNALVKAPKYGRWWTVNNVVHQLCGRRWPPFA